MSVPSDGSRQFCVAVNFVGRGGDLSLHPFALRGPAADGRWQSAPCRPNVLRVTSLQPILFRTLAAYQRVGDWGSSTIPLCICNNGDIQGVVFSSDHCNPMRWGRGASRANDGNTWCFDTTVLQESISLAPFHKDELIVFRALPRPQASLKVTFERNHSEEISLARHEGSWHLHQRAGKPRCEKSCGFPAGLGTLVRRLRRRKANQVQRRYKNTAQNSRKKSSKRRKTDSECSEEEISTSLIIAKHSLLDIPERSRVDTTVDATVSVEVFF